MNRVYIDSNLHDISWHGADSLSIIVSKSSILNEYNDIRAPYPQLKASLFKGDECL